MNKIYRVIYNKETGTYNAVSEYAKAQGKSSSSNGVVGSLSQGIYTAVRFAYTIIMSGVLIATGQVAFGAEVKGSNAANVISNGKNACFYDTASQSVVCGDGTTTVETMYNGKTAKSVALGLNAKTAGESNVALGANSSASHQSGLAIGANTQAHNSQTIAIGEGAKSLGAVDISIGKSAGAFIAKDDGTIEIKSSGNNIAIGESTLANSTANRNNMVAIGTNAGSGGNATHSVAIGADAGKGMTSNNNTAVGYKSVVNGGSSSSFGHEANAAAEQSTAIGYSADATGTYTTALGANAQATQNFATALGGGNIANTAANATGFFSTAVGYGSKSSGRNALAAGVNSNATGLGSTALGSGANTTKSTAGATTQATGAIAISATTDNDATQKTTASGNQSIAIGVSATASAQNAMALGRTTQALGQNSIAQGVSAKVDANGTNAIAIGVRANNNEAGMTTGASSVALGADTNAAASGSIAIGKQAKVQVGTSTVDSGDKVDGQNSIAIGADSFVSGTNAMAIGQSSSATGQNATAVGNDNTASGKSAVAIGDGSSATKDSAVALGSYTFATGVASVSIGLNSKASEKSNIAIGNSAKAETGTATIAIGENSSVTADNSMALGTDAKATVADGVALGSNSVANVDKGVGGADPLSAKEATAPAGVWTSTRAAVSVGNGTTATRQITSVAAGTADTDAVNVAQLKAAGFKLTATHAGGGESATVADDKIQNGETLTIDAGKNIKVTHTANQVSIATKDEVDFDTVTSNDITVNAGGSLVLGSDVMVEMGDNVVTGVADGEVSANSSDAINGSQLHATNTKVDTNTTNIKTNADNIAKGLNFGANDQSATSGNAINRKLGETLNVKGGMADDTSADKTSGENVITRTDGDTINIELAKDAKFDSVIAGGTKIGANGLTFVDSNGTQIAGSPSVTKDGINAGNKKITGVADGEVSATSKEGINGSQLHATNTKVEANTANITALQNQTFKLQANDDTASAVKAGDTVKFLDGDNIEITRTGNDITVATAKDVSFDSVKVGDDITLDSVGVKVGDVNITTGGIDMGGHQITNLADGTVSKDSKDAINGSQLFNAQNNIANYLGGGAEMKDGQMTAPTYTINKADGKTPYATPAKNVGDVLTQLNSYVNEGFKILDNAGIQKAKVQPQDQVQFVNGKGTTSTVTQEDNGVTKVQYDVAIDNKTIKVDTDGKLYADVTDTNSVTKLADGSTTTVTPNANGDETTYTVEVNKAQVNTTATDTANADKITVNTAGKVVKPTDNTKAVNSFVTADVLADVVNSTGFNIQANGDTKSLVKAGDTVQFIDGDNIEITRDGNNITVATAKDVEFETVMVGDDVTIDEAGLRAGDVNISTKGIDAGNQKITNVADGAVTATSKDAVNGSQLFAQGEGVKNIIGGNTTYNPATGAYENADIGGTGKGNIHDAIQSINAKAGVKTKVSAGDGVIVENSGTAEAPNYKVSANVDNSTVQIVGGKISAKTANLTTGTDGKATAGDTTSLVTANQVATAINNAGLSFSGDVADDTTNKFARTNQQETKIVGGQKDKTKLTDNNIGVVSNGTDTLTVKLAKDINLGDTGSVKTGNTTINNDGVKVGGVTLTNTGLTAGDVKVTKDGIDAGNKKITNVADGAVTATSKDAINGSQLRNTAGDIATIIGGNASVDDEGNVTASNIGGTGKDNINDAIKASKTTVSSNDSSIKVTKTTDGTTGADNYDVSVNAQAISENAQLPVVYTKADGTKVYKVGDKFFDNKAGTGAEIPATDIIASMQNADGTISPTTLANVKAGVKPTDAVNVSQLSPLATALGTTVANDGTVKAPSFIVTKTDGTKYAGATTIQGALDNIGTEIQKPLTFAGDSGTNVTRKLGTQVNVKGGATGALTDDNIGVVSNGTDTLTVKLAKDIDLGATGSVKTGNTTVNNDGITIKAPTSGTTTDVKLTATGLNNGGNKVTNVADGEVSANSSDAVNGSQLFATNTKVEANTANIKTNTDNIAKGLNFGANDQSKSGNKAINRQLGDTINIKGAMADDTSADKTSGENVITRTTADGNINIELAKDVKFDSAYFKDTGGNETVVAGSGIAIKPKDGKDTDIISLNTNGLTMGGQKIKNLADGEISATSKEGINGSQLFAQGEGVKSIIGGKTTYNPVTGAYENTDIGGTGKKTIDEAIKASKTTVSSNDSSIKVTKTTDGTTGADNYDVSVNAQAISENAQLPVVYTKADGTKVYKVGDKFFDNKAGTGAEIPATDIIASMQNADGTISPTTLANVKAGVKPTDAVNVSQLSPLATALGTTVANDGTVKAPSFIVTKTDGTKYAGATTIQGALDNIGTEIQKPLTFAGDSGTNVTRKLGTTVNLKGGVTDTAKLTDNNIGIVADGTDTLTVKLAKDIDLGATGSVKTGNTTVNNDGVKVGDVTLTNTGLTAGDVKVTKGGINAGNKVISGVANGVADTDAVNVSQLKAYQADNEKTTTAQAGSDKVTVKGTTTGNNTNYVIDLSASTKDDIAKGVSAKDIVDNKGLTFTGDAGTTGTKKLGDSIAITGDSNISTVATGTGVQVKLNDNITVKGVTADQANIGGKVTINSAGINAGNTQITNVAEGVKATDAVNVSQLTKSVAGAKTEVKGTGLATVSSAKGANGQEVYTVDVAKAKAPTVTRGNVAVNADDADKVMTAGDIAKAINASERTSSVKAGSNAVTVKVGAEDTSGNTEYTIDVATDKTISRTNDGKLTVNAGNSLKVDGSTGKINVNTDGTTITADPTTGAIKANTTNLTNTNGKVNAPTAEDADKLVNAKTVADAINASGFTLTTSASAGAVAGTTKELINPSETITVDAGKNIAITQKGNTISVATKDDVNFNNVAISDKGSLTVGKDSKVDMGGNQITNLKSGLNGKTLDQIKADDKAPERSNAATIGDLAQVQNNVTNITNITNNILGNDVVDNTKTTNVKEGDKLGTGANASVALIDTTNVLKDKDGKPILTTYNVSGQTEYIQNDVIQAINHMNEQGIKFFHVNDGVTKAEDQAQNTIDSSASGAYATAVGYQTSASGEGAVAMGNTYNTTDTQGQAVAQRTQASGKNAIAIGTGSQANAENTIAIGTGNVVTGKNSGAIGDPSFINGDDSYSMGNHNRIGSTTKNAFALGNDVYLGADASGKDTVDVSGAVALGNQATVTEKSSVALGEKAVAGKKHTTADGGNYTYAGANDANVAGVNNVVGVVSVGNDAQTRQIQNVSAGVVSANSTDAINGSQLYDTHQAIANVGNQLANRIGDVEDKANAGTSSAMAMASLPQAYLPGKSMLTGGMATYNGEGAVAVGLSKLSDNGRWVLKISGSADTQGNAGGAIGAGFHF